MTAIEPKRPPDLTGPSDDGSQNVHGKVRLTIAADNSAAIVFVGSGASPEAVSVMALTALAEERGLAMTVELTESIVAIADAFKACPGADLERVIVHGTPVVPGVDGRLELLQKFDPTHHVNAAPEADGHPSPMTRVDHHTRSVFITVTKGEVIGHLLAPVIGREGIDVFGRALNPRDARPLKLLTDETILVDLDGTITAFADGTLVRNGNTLRISPRLEVPDNVDFSTGNIHFPGDVVINRGVRDCFQVHAGRTLLIRDLVEAAEIISDMDMTLEGGMAGRQKGSIRAKRDVHALYLEQVKGRVGRDLILNKEATHVHLHVGRAVLAPTAALIAGDICVAGQVDIAQLGSDASPVTKIAIGHLPDVDEKLRAISELLQRVMDKREAAATMIQQLQNATSKMTAQQAEELTEREFELSNFDHQIVKLRSSIGSLLRLLEAAGEPSLTVHADMWPGVKLWIGGYLCEPRQAIRGPLKITLTPHGEPQLLLKTSGVTSSLSTVCRVIHDDRFIARAAMYTLAAQRPSSTFSDESPDPTAA